ncbi:MAG: hypothetical protein EOM87_05760 [Clostridia bacterium]|nr:hypothetical protein [Clostridia bacterium]
MSITEIFLIGIALSMDAFAVSVTNGVSDSDMKMPKMLLIAFFFGFFQMIMPLAGFFSSGALSLYIAKVAPWLSFTILAVIGIKMIIDATKTQDECGAKLTIGRLSVQAIATSIDAFAVGISLLAIELSGGGLPLNIVACAAIIGIITFILSLCAVILGKFFTKMVETKVGNIKKWTIITGGIVLIAIGIKIIISAYI